MVPFIYVVLFLAMSGHSSANYCLCKDGVNEQTLQKTLDYACGAGADCTPINQNGPCYNPNTVKDHCNYAVNSYFQKKGQAQGSCDFSGTATVSVNPPSNIPSTCSFPSSGTSTTPSTGTPTTPSTGTPTTPTTGTPTTPTTGTPTTTPTTGTPTTPTTGTPTTGTSTGTPTTTPTPLSSYEQKGYKNVKASALGAPAIRVTSSSNDLLDSQVKEQTEKEELDRNQSSHRFPFWSLFSDNSPLTKYDATDNGFASDPFTVGTPRSRHRLTMLLLKSSLVVIVILALTGSFWWTLSISTSSRGHIYHSSRRLQEQLVSDLWDIGELSFGTSRMKEIEFCPGELENYIPCFNVSENLDSGFSDGNEYDRVCRQGSRQNCLVLPPMNYKIPLRWPTGRDIIWVANVKITGQEVFTSGSLTKRMMMLEEEQISFRSASLMFDGVEDYSHQIAEMIGLRNESNFIQAGIRTILDIGCGYGSFGAHLFSEQILTICIANYESSGSQVQLTLERGLPAMIGSFSSKQLPYPSLSFDLLHCARCGIDWDKKDGTFLIEVDRVLRPGGYFVWTSPLINVQSSLRNKEKQKRWNFVRDFAENLCWELMSQQDETVVWKKTSKKTCYNSRKSGSGPSICSKVQDVEFPYYRPLQNCIGGMHSRRWFPIEERATWPSRSNLNRSELALYGLHLDELNEDTANYRIIVRNYWSLLSPLIFSDHPKRPGDEDPSPPYNMLRNVLDMNARYGGLNAALLEARKSVWVMNVVPTTGPKYLPLILDRGYFGVLHDWCEAFPTYPRTYDMVHAEGLLSLESSQHWRCTMVDIFTEIDRMLRPEGWIIIRDTALLIDSARVLTRRLKWEARVIEIESNNDERLLICQKPFFKRQPS